VSTGKTLRAGSIDQPRLDLGAPRRAVAQANVAVMPAGSVLTSHLGVAQPVAWRTGLRRNGRRRSADRDRGSLR
jgi:hypothetical protein